MDLNYIQEPLLEFGFGQCLEHPKDGLFFFGPIRDRQKPVQMRVGVLGTPQGIDRYRNWVRAITEYVPPMKHDSLHHTAFPGFEAVFKTAWPEVPIVEIPISPGEISNRIRLSDRHHAIYETVSLYEEQIRKRLREDDFVIDVWFVVIPDEVYQLGRPLSKVPSKDQIQVNRALGKKLARRLSKEPSMFEEDMKAAKVYGYDVNFHHQLKARLLDTKAVVQVVRESSLATIKSSPLDVRRGLQDPASLAWNLCTTAFYKAGGRPWKLADVREGVCYVGLVFKMNNKNLSSGNSCYGAQMFLDSGEGLVFKGINGDWYREENREFHLDSEEAHKLVARIVESYTYIHGKPPAELFIHGRTRFSFEEWEGFRKAVPATTNVVGVRITRSQDMKLYRLGRTPVLRGTSCQLNSYRALLWSAGFVPRLNTYPGREVPNPLLVEISRGEANIENVLKDILALTKLNFNSCIFGDGIPVTLRFADAVGEILTAAPQVEGPPLPFRHYI